MRPVANQSVVRFHPFAPRHSARAKVCSNHLRRAATLMGSSRGSQSVLAKHRRAVELVSGALRGGLVGLTQDYRGEQVAQRVYVNKSHQGNYLVAWIPADFCPQAQGLLMARTLDEARGQLEHISLMAGYSLADLLSASISKVYDELEALGLPELSFDPSFTAQPLPYNPGGGAFQVHSFLVGIYLGVGEKKPYVATNLERTLNLFYQRLFPKNIFDLVARDCTVTLAEKLGSLGKGRWPIWIQDDYRGDGKRLIFKVLHEDLPPDIQRLWAADQEPTAHDPYLAAIYNYLQNLLVDGTAGLRRSLLRQDLPPPDLKPTWSFQQTGSDQGPSKDLTAGLYFSLMDPSERSVEILGQQVTRYINRVG